MSPNLKTVHLLTMVLSSMRTHFFYLSIFYHRPHTTTATFKNIFQLHISPHGSEEPTTISLFGIGGSAPRGTSIIQVYLLEDFLMDASSQISLVSMQSCHLFRRTCFLEMSTTFMG
ncbi:hypothetical protein SESBI_40012 [Sesbania bispinosa]|nr:hypothetical protein SESBI_40012 [Sesbania bispinosa]